MKQQEQVEPYAVQATEESLEGPEERAQRDFWDIPRVRLFIYMYNIKDEEVKIEYPTTMRLVKWTVLIVAILSLGVMLKEGFLWYTGYVAMTTWAVIRTRRIAIALRRAFKDTVYEITRHQHRYLFIEKNKHAL